MPTKLEVLPLPRRRCGARGEGSREEFTDLLRGSGPEEGAFGWLALVIAPPPFSGRSIASRKIPS